MPADVIELHPRFDPLAASSERRYDGVATAINRIRVRRRQLGRTLAELERQFVENDLLVRTGPRRGQPLGPAGRRRRLKKLTDQQDELARLRVEEERLLGHLDRMQSALEAWAHGRCADRADDRHLET